MAKDYWKSRKWKLSLLFLVICDVGAFPEARSPEIKKRQIYREGVLPAQGGVIPEWAFANQRLKHNIHDTLGIEAPDGYLFVVRETDTRPGPRDPEDERDILTLTNHKLQGQINSKGASPVRPQPTTYLLRRPTLEDLYPSRYITNHQGPPLLFSSTAHRGWHSQPFSEQIFITYPRSSKY
ncbi:uncharacterized protein [Macrobrachium rosenbergii]|uniref:uncharacterized protein n=1 Tax=Macrobrachium rosenbergii TaxID=79674 RepID=UPI0034D43737